jgi:hypothetical protein
MRNDANSTSTNAHSMDGLTSTIVDRAWRDAVTISFPKRGFDSPHPLSIFGRPSGCAHAPDAIRLRHPGDPHDGDGVDGVDDSLRARGSGVLPIGGIELALR